MRINLLVIEWTQILTAIFGSASFTTIVLFLLRWVRFNKNDTSVNNKTDADAAKVQAEAYEIKARADVGIADAALKVAQRLGEENEMTKKQLDKTQADLENAMNSLRDATIKLNEIQHELNNERQKNVLQQKEIEDLKAELAKYRNNGNG